MAAGTLIGTVGRSGRATGSHLHVEVRRFGEAIDPAWAMRAAQATISHELATTTLGLVPTV